MKSRLLEVMIIRQGVLNLSLTHQLEGDAVNERPILVRPAGK